jgi:predicted amidohydrolase YtcJ
VFALHFSCHSGVANSRALELAGIARSTPDPSGGYISRGRNDVPDGHLLERGMSRVERLARASLCASDAEGFFTRVGEHYRALAAAGITCVVDAAVPGDLGALYREAHARGKVTLPTVLMPVSTTGYLEAPWDALDGPPTGTQDGLLSVGPVKLILDGAPSCAICLSWWQFAGVALSMLALCVRRGSLDPVRASSSTRPRIGRRIETGIRLYRPDEARDLIRAVAERGFAVAPHAEGNVAIEQALDAYAAAGSGLDRAGAPRLEHVAFADRDLAARVAASGVTVVTQPGFLSLPGLENAPTIPGIRTLPLRWLLDGGALVAGSSDFPVVDFDPLISLRSAVRRTVKGGGVREPDQTITLDEAITLHTRNGARAAGRFAELGSLEVGKRADFVVLTGPLEKDADLDAVRVRTTVSGGQVVHGAFG